MAHGTGEPVAPGVVGAVDVVVDTAVVPFLSLSIRFLSVRYGQCWL
nr:hypothetical protein [Halomonas sp.]